MTSILVIPDCHSKPEGTSDRFTWLGKYIVEQQPDSIVCLGDFLDMKSLSSYDVGKGSGEGQRVKLDIEAGVRDCRALFAPLDAYNDIRRARKEKQYLPDSKLLLGNHEDRLRKFLNDHPALLGMLNLDFLEHYWGEVVPFKTPLIHEQIAFSHYWPTKTATGARGGKHAARTHVDYNHMSSVSGHSHEKHYAVTSRVDGQKLFGLVAGYYGQADYTPGYAVGTSQDWWNGVVMLREVENGFAEHVEFVTQKSLREKYEA